MVDSGNIGGLVVFEVGEEAGFLLLETADFELGVLKLLLEG